MAVLAKPINFAFVVKHNMAKKFLKHSNVSDLDFIKESARNFEKNQEALKKKNARTR